MKTKMYNDYIETNELDSDGTRYGYASSIKPETFGDMSFKFQGSGQKHKDTYWTDL
ncbi:hypothetical protein [Ekhidna sp.]|jgi:hypothetical protein|uniref:hypothetical protein n=1 Tax=Ekhidna sp. TaxID=2608089 RepID=UPI0032EB3233